jgi:predicted transcriptional regulator
MKKLNINQFDEKEEEIADILISLGMRKNVATTLAYMQNTKTATSIELERSARLRQPEVSIAMRELNWSFKDV